MAGQGVTTQMISHRLVDQGWSIVYTCIPNTPHVLVVPITIYGGSSKQRYPDIVAYRNNITKLIEVEVRLNEDVARDIRLRFNEMCDTLLDKRNWELWRAQILKVTTLSMPLEFIPSCDLVICSTIDPGLQNLVEYLGTASINVIEARSYLR